MRRKIGKWKVGIILFLLAAVCAKVCKARFYDHSSILSMFSGDSQY